MKILGIEEMDGERLGFELQRGGRFVVYQYCISLIIVTFRRPSDVYFVRTGESAIAKGLVFSLISLLLGW